MARGTRYVVVGGGILGLATAHRLTLDRPDAEVTVLENEGRWTAHQTGHNSGVIHAGVYYQPDSLKARLCQAGSRCARAQRPVAGGDQLVGDREHLVARLPG